jgi:hypothetical protein
MGLLTGLVVDYGYDKLIENFHLDTAKEHFAAYLLSKDSDLNKEQADILASAAIKVTKEAGRILTHKMAANGVQALRKHFAEKGPKIFKAPEVKVGEGVKVQENKSSYDIAKEGGKHSRTYNDYNNLPNKSLEKSIRSFEKKVEIHENLISNPEKYLEVCNKYSAKWMQLSAEGRAKQIINWQQEIAGFLAQRNIMESILKSRE